MESPRPFQLLVLIVLASQAVIAVPTIPMLCVTSMAELQKCKTFHNIMCLIGSDALDCMKKISGSPLHGVTSLDGGYIYRAGKCYGLKPILAEKYNNMPGGKGYYAVAVAKKSSHVTINTLEGQPFYDTNISTFGGIDGNGKKSCHTGLNKTAGWFIPMSVLFSDKNNQLEQASNFFTASCVPGAMSGTNMCMLCTPNCKRNSDNLYYGYDGAARCLKETDADVAFVKHTTFLNEADKGNYELLCRDGTTANIDDYETCHLAATPSHAIVGRNSLSSDVIIDIFYNFDSIGDELLFSTQYGKNLIFSDNTDYLMAQNTSYIDFLGPQYMNALPEVSC